MDYQKMIAERNEKNAYAKLNGIQILEIREGYCRTVVDVQEQHMNPIGSVHGGCLYSMADVAAGAAAASFGLKATTVDANFHYLRAGIGSRQLTAEATVLKRGKRILFLNTSVFDEQGTMLASGTFTYMVLEETKDPWS